MNNSATPPLQAVMLQLLAFPAPNPALNGDWGWQAWGDIETCRARAQYPLPLNEPDAVYKTKEFRQTLRMANRAFE